MPSTINAIGGSQRLRRNTIARAAAGGFLLLLASCGTGGINAVSDCEVEGDSFEARSWIDSNSSPAPLASNRFGSRAAAAAFVDTLYTLGADSVTAVDVWDDDMIGTYTASLIVWLPQERGPRRGIFAISAREAAADGFEPERDTGQRCLFLWWD